MRATIAINTTTEKPMPLTHKEFVKNSPAVGIYKDVSVSSAGGRIIVLESGKLYVDSDGTVEIYEPKQWRSDTLYQRVTDETVSVTFRP